MTYPIVKVLMVISLLAVALAFIASTTLIKIRSLEKIPAAQCLPIPGGKR